VGETAPRAVVNPGPGFRGTSGGASSAPPTATHITSGVDLTGKCIMITGATTGLGEAAARVLAAAGARMIITGRTAASASLAADRMMRDIPSSDVTPIALDLGSLRSVRACADAVLRTGRALDVLIANAGVMAVPFGRTVEGFETHIGVNHLGHFALVTALESALAAGAPARVVVLSSSGHRWFDVDLGRLADGPAEYRKFAAYGASKTANALFAVELDRRWSGRGVRAFAVHPGGVPGTGLLRHLSESERDKLRASSSSDSATSGLTVDQGAARIVWASVSADLRDVGGVYLENCEIAAVTGPESATGVRDFAMDADRARKLWLLSDELIAP
jgi:NAD(P)-dependent dehydrogenase (short-subunit alcohol dehydrogenase family)